MGSGALVAAGDLLRAGVAGNANSRPSKNYWTGKSPGRSRTAADRFQPHHAASRHRADPGGAAVALSAWRRHCHGRGGAAEDAASAAGLAVLQTLGLSTGILAGGCAFQRVSLAAVFRIPGKFSLRRRNGGPRL